MTADARTGLAAAGGARRPTAVFVSSSNNPLQTMMPILEHLVRSGWRVVGVGWSDYHLTEVRGEGVEIHYMRIGRRIFEPLAHLDALRSLCRLYRTVRPDLACHLSLNPLLYGSLAARLTGVPARANLILGLGGSVVTSRRWDAPLLRAWIRTLGKVSLGGSGVRVLVRNPDDLEVAHRRLGIPRPRLAIVGGGGVDLERFTPAPEPPGPTVALFAGRLMKPKGIYELVEASRILRQRGRPLEVRIAGFADPAAIEGIPSSRIEAWQRAGLVQWLGPRDDLPELLKRAHIATLPSYREGMSRFLMEAAAAGRPIVTTDVPGCRDVVRHQWNGLLVQPGDAVGLADALERMAGDRGLRAVMGRRSRTRAEAEFGYDSTLRRHLEIFSALLPARFEAHAPSDLETAIQAVRATGP